MARIETRLAKTLYFCNVKSQTRHEVAGSASVFRASYLLELKYNPNVRGSSNARKGFAQSTLTARIGVFLCLKII
jgi:hypothetical protein